MFHGQHYDTFSAISVWHACDRHSVVLSHLTVKILHIQLELGRSLGMTQWQEIYGWLTIRHEHLSNIVSITTNELVQVA